MISLPQLLIEVPQFATIQLNRPTFDFLFLL
jgi:hypothetical protein